jgi:phosphoglycolate phosphatase
VATSKPEPFALEIVRHFGLEERFRRVYGSGLDGARSAKADLLRWILEREGRVAAAAVMVGDREHDMAGAAANGMAGVGVLWGYGREGDLRAAGAGWIVASPGDLSALLAEGRPAGS